VTSSFFDDKTLVINFFSFVFDDLLSEMIQIQSSVIITGIPHKSVQKTQRWTVLIIEKTLFKSV